MFHIMSYTKDKNQKGFTLVVVMLLISVMLLLAAGFISSVIAENKIAFSQVQSIKAQYLSEAGLQEAFWRIQNNPEYAENFESDENWEEIFSREDVFSSGSSYKVIIKNIKIADADITAIGYKAINSNSKARRMNKKGIFKPISEISDEIPNEDEVSDESGGSFPQEQDSEINLDNSVLFSAKGINVWGINLDASGNIYSGGDFNISLWSDIKALGKINAVSDINKDAVSAISADEIHSQNINPPAADLLNMPAVSFDAAGYSGALKTKAQNLNQVYTSEQFSALLSQNPVQNFNGAVYITGNADILRGVELIINGAIASDGVITIGNDWQWWDPCSPSDVKITVNSLEGEPSGIFAKNQIVVKSCAGNILVNGVIYAGYKVSLFSSSNNLRVNGSLIAREIEGTGIWKPITLVFNNEINENSLAVPSEYAPIIDISHWEEEY